MTDMQMNNLAYRDVPLFYRAKSKGGPNKLKHTKRISKLTNWRINSTHMIKMGQFLVIQRQDSWVMSPDFTSKPRPKDIDFYHMKDHVVDIFAQLKQVHS